MTSTRRSSAGSSGRGERKEFTGTQRFELRRKLGEGAFGVVFEAWDRERGERVALKTLRHWSPQELYRFKQEFRGLADITHPNLVALHELLSEDDHVFFTMELIEGDHLLDWVRVPGAPRAPSTDSDVAATVIADSGNLSEPLPSAPTIRASVPASTPDSDSYRRSSPSIAVPSNETRLRAALVELARGLHALHEAGKLHRDIKPSNVLVTREGRVKIVDFGLLSELDGEANPASESRLAGTPEYMSPEQAAGQQATGVSDWYAVGTVLYEALAGRLPFEGNVATVLTEKLLNEPVPPSEHARSVPVDLEALCMDLLRRKAEERPSGDEVIRRLGEASLAAPVKSRSVPLVGRSTHLAALHTAAISARERAVCMLLHGRSGMGKTTVVRRFLDELRRRETGTVILAGRCYEQESVPYKALDTVVDALSQHLKTASESELPELMPPHVASLARVFPVLRQLEWIHRAEATEPEIADAQEQRRRAFGALREILARIGERKPLVVFIDNLHWGDADSAALLSDILEGPQAPRLLFVGTYRSEDADASAMLPPLRGALSRSASLDVREVEVAEIGEDDARTLTRALLGGDDSRVESIAQEGRGSPFFLDVLARHAQLTPAEGVTVALPSQGTDASRPPQTALDDVIWSRTRQLPQDARQLLEVVAVAGKPVPLGVARAAAGVKEVRGAVAMLRSGHLLRTRGMRDRDAVESYHDRIRESLVARIARDELAAIHRRLAEAWEASGLGDDETLTLHFHRSGDLRRAAEYAERAARRATEMLAFDRAASFYRLALELSDPPGDRSLRVRLGDALRHAGRGGEAADVYLAAAHGAESTEGLRLRTHAVESLLRSGRIDDGLRELRGVLDGVSLKYPPTPRHALASLLYHRARIRVRGLGFTRREESTLPRDEILAADVCRSVAQGLGIVDTIRGADFQTRHTLRALELGEPYRAACALALEGAFSSLGGSSTANRTHAVFEKCFETARTVDNPHAMALAMLARGVARCLEGRFADGLQDSDEATRTFLERCAHAPWDLVQAQFYAMTDLMWLGRLAELSRRLPGSLRSAEDRNDTFAATALRTYLLYYDRLATDDADRGRHEVRDALARWSQQGFHVQHWWALMAECQLALYLGDGAAAHGLLASRWPELAGSLLLQVQYAKIEAHQLRARCALALARESRWKRPALLWSAERDAAVIERRRTAWGDALATLIRASASALRGSTGRASTLFASAEQALEACGMRLYAAAARRRRGELEGGTQGQALVASADAWMNAEGIRRPEHFAAMLAPSR